MERDIRIKWFFSQSPEKVWECLTDSEMLGHWLMKNNFKPVTGHRFNFYTKPLPRMGFDGIIYCEVLEIIPFKRLVYSWKGGPEPGVIRLNTTLHWTLAARDGGTEVLLEHKGFKGLSNYLSSIFMGNGWKKSIQRRFQALLDAATPLAAGNNQ